MKAFLEEISKQTGLDMGVLSDGYRIINLSSRAVYVEGMKNILSFSDAQVTLKLKKGAVKIEGKALVIKELMIDSVFITGEILKVEVS